MPEPPPSPPPPPPPPGPAPREHSQASSSLAHEDTPISTANRSYMIPDGTKEDPYNEDDEFYDVDDGRGSGVAYHQRQVSSSALEYSDTATDDFSPQQPQPLLGRNDPSFSSSSTFRMHYEALTKSMRVVRFSSDDFEDEDEENQQQASRTTSSRTHRHQQRHGGNRASRGGRHSHHSSHHHNRKQQHQHDRDRGLASSWMKQLAYSFRTPSPRPDQRHHWRGDGNGDSKTQEYPHLSSQMDNTSERYNSDSNRYDDEQSPLLLSAVSSYRGVGGTTSSTTTGTTFARSNKPTDLLVQAAGLAPPPRGTTLVAASTGATESDDEQRNKSNKRQEQPDQNHFVSIAAAFLRDYESNRPPTFAARSLLEITDRQLELYNIRYGSYLFPVVLGCATVGFFVSSFLEGFFNLGWHRIFLTFLNLFGLLVYGVDLCIMHELRRPCEKARSYYHPHRPHHHYRGNGSGSMALSRQQQQQRLPRNGLDHVVRTSRSTRLFQPMILFGIVLGLENLARLFVTPQHSLVLFSSLFKPLILFYVSSKARDALEALRRIMRIVIRVLLMELLLILMFAAVACRLFSDHETFHNLTTSWLSLFQLATTVVNPSIWMPMYRASKGSAVFFIFFIIASVFYMHSLVLSVVFQTYVHAATEIHQRSATDRDDSIELAFMALNHHEKNRSSAAGGGGSSSSRARGDVIGVDLVRDVLRMVRPHYNAMKINALVEIVAPASASPSNKSESNGGKNKGSKSTTTVDYAVFRTKIRQALNASIRTARSASPMAMTAELVAVLVAVVNFIYVILVSSDFDEAWFNSWQNSIGCAITLVAGFELFIRFNPLRIPDFTPLTRLNATFDGLAVCAAVMSCIGMVLFVMGHKSSLEYILMGRALDMIRIMRFFQIFRDIVRRSSDVFPALLGPVILVVTTVHVFVYTGMALWGGAIDIGSYGDLITPLYDLNNFNSYQEGAVTIFQVLVVNDWHAIAQVFLYASRCSSPFVVYPFFVMGNLVGVSIMLNVLTAFFVETFVTKLNDDTDGPAEATTTIHKERDYSIRTSENTPLRRISSSNSFGHLSPSRNDSDHDADSEGSSESELYEFDVYEREGFDKIMQTVAGGSNNNVGGDFARHICSYLEIFESLSPGRQSVGWLVCDQQTLERFGNRRFQSLAKGFLEESELHVVVTDMHSELLALTTRATFTGRSLIRKMPHKQGGSLYLEISASLLRLQPALSLFVSRVQDENDDTVGE